MRSAAFGRQHGAEASPRLRSPAPRLARETAASDARRRPAARRRPCETSCGSGSRVDERPFAPVWRRAEQRARLFVPEPRSGPAISPAIACAATRISAVQSIDDQRLLHHRHDIDDAAAPQGIMDEMRAQGRARACFPAAATRGRHALHRSGCARRHISPCRAWRRGLLLHGARCRAAAGRPSAIRRRR